MKEHLLNKVENIFTFATLFSEASETVYMYDRVNWNSTDFYNT